MSLLFTIVRAAHANGTHHKLALDALTLLEGPDAEGWRRLFISQAEAYMAGAKAPDDKFKDFQNHVLHVRDAYWGGAPTKAEAWYQDTVRALAAQDWPTAVFNAGVLSHYLSDPIMPFHTAQSEAENNIHAAVEQSCSKSYDDLKAYAEKMLPVPLVAASQSPQWVREIVVASAEASNKHYETLIAHFDIHKAVVDPPSGLDQNARRVIAEMQELARVTIAVVLGRALAEAAVAPPQVSLTAQTLLAGLKIPLKWVTKKIADAQERAEIERMYDELQATGKVEQTLRQDERTVRAAWDAEVVANAARERERARAAVLSGAKPSLASLSMRGADTSAAPAIIAPTVPAAALPPDGLVDRLTALISGGPEPEAKAAVAPETSVPVIPGPVVRAADPEAAPAEAAAAAAAIAAAIAVPLDPPADPEVEDTLPPAAAARGASRPAGVGVGDDVERAPSIGPKTAARLHAAGVRTIADLLAADPGVLSEQLATGWITARVVKDWQDQARLVTEVPGLKGGAAQLLVGAGFRSVAALALADRHDLMTAVLKYAGTTEGQRVLRDAPPPDLAKVTAWIDAARTVKAA